MSLVERYVPSRLRGFAASLWPAETGLAGQARIVVLALVHAAALWRMWTTEVDLSGKGLFLFSWVLLNCLWLLVLRRPAVSALLSLAVVEIIVRLSQLKFDITWMTITALDVMIVDPDTMAFLVGIVPQLRDGLVIGVVLALAGLALAFRNDPLRVGSRVASAGVAGSLAGLVVLSAAFPERPHDPFQGVNHVSGFARSGILSLSELMARGWFEADRSAPETLPPAGTLACTPPAKRPHILLVLDESSMDLSAAPGLRLPANYRDQFRSQDGKVRQFVAEASGGPTWYTEYNVLTGLSVQSFGKMKFYVTRLAAERVARGLPAALKDCGYRTFSLYPAYGAFLGARRFQQTTGIQRLYDAHEMRADWVEPDHFYFDQAARLIAREKGAAPLFLFVYTTANHFPWSEVVRPELTPKDWTAPGNAPEVDEYLRRQAMSAVDYRAFRERLSREFPGEPFLIVRFGDHPPSIAHRLIDPALSDRQVAERVLSGDPDYFTTYYSIDTINFDARNLASARERLDAPFLPLAVLEAAGLPLDPTFVEQKRILERCNGMFHRCRDGAEARRFNRLLIDAGYIKGL
jgi:Sulfatase